MKTKLFVVLAAVAVFVIPALSFSENARYTITVPDSMPSIIGQTIQKDKPAIVLIQTIVRGNAVYPSLVQTLNGPGSLVGSWQSNFDTIAFSANGQFNGVYSQTGGPFAGNYSIQANVITLNYTAPVLPSRQFAFTVAGNSLTVFNPQTGAVTYLKTSPAGQGAEGDFVANANNITLVPDPSTAAQIITEPVVTGVSGTGFIVSPDGYIVTNAHVVLAGRDLEQMLFESGAKNLQQQLFAEAEKLYKIPADQKEKVVGILSKKILEYFTKYGKIKDIGVSYEIFSGIASSNEDLKTKVWLAELKKKGTVSEIIGNEERLGKDIAILKVDKNNLPAVTLGDANKVQTGDSVFVIGYPGTGLEYYFKQESILEPTTTQGVISAKRTLTAGTETFQTDAAVNHGNSGGPAYNDKGEVIGIATFGPDPKTEISSINFLISINHAKEFMKELNIQNQHSIIDKRYLEGLKAFWRNDCRTTINKMRQVQALYPGHPYAQYYIDASENAISTGRARCPLYVPLAEAAAALAVVIGILLFIKKLTTGKKNTAPK